LTVILLLLYYIYFSSHNTVYIAGDRWRQTEGQKKNYRNTRAWCLSGETYWYVLGHLSWNFV